MNIAKVTIKGFRSFSNVGSTIELKHDLNVFVGLNSSGKTAALEALIKIFGLSNSERDIKKEDFHVPIDEGEEVTERKLSIEVKFEFNGNDDETVPHFFNHMVIDGEGKNPYIRIRLESIWTKSEFSEEGEVETNLIFIDQPEGEAETEESRKTFPKHLRGLIQILYVPAIRKPSDQIKYVSGSILYRVLRLLNFGEDFKGQFNTKLGEINDLFSELEEFKEIQKSLTKYWTKFHKDNRYKESNLGFGSSDLDSILKKLEVSFSPSGIHRSYNVNDLGEGYRSLFYFTLVCALLEVEGNLNVDDDSKPILTILLVEEPENHIAPQLLGRVVSILKSISKQDNSQVFLSSHSPSIVKRIEPESILHFRIDRSFSTVISLIPLPEEKDEAYKYVREAIKNYPEIYFAKLAVIGEGDSEEIIINKLMEIYEVDFDDNIITFIPLGHRFVNHIWKLLGALNIPHVTLLDLDVGRNGGGWGRIKYILNQLIENGTNRDKLLELSDGKILSQERLEEMHKWEYEDNQLDNLLSWVNSLETYDVFYSSPLDIDFLMLEKYTKSYQSIIPKGGGPRIPDKLKEEKTYSLKLESAIQATLKSENAKGETFTTEQKELMIWYNYLFLGRGKPSTHINALSEINDEELKKNIPKVFERIFKRINELLKDEESRS